MCRFLKLVLAICIATSPVLIYCSPQNSYGGGGAGYSPHEYDVSASGRNGDEAYSEGASYAAEGYAAANGNSGGYAANARNGGNYAASDGKNGGYASSTGNGAGYSANAKSGGGYAARDGRSGGYYSAGESGGSYEYPYYYGGATGEVSSYSSSGGGAPAGSYGNKQNKAYRPEKYAEHVVSKYISYPKNKGEILVHRPPPIIVKRPPTKVLVNHPPLVVKPAPVVVHKPPAVVMRKVQVKHLPRPVKVDPIYVNVIKPAPPKYDHPQDYYGNGDGGSYGGSAPKAEYGASGGSSVSYDRPAPMDVYGVSGGSNSGYGRPAPKTEYGGDSGWSASYGGPAADDAPSNDGY